MHPFRKLRYKTRIGLMLGTLLLFLVLNNLANRASIERMERTANSVYEDRLMPSTFIFELRELLDEEQAINMSASHLNAEMLRQKAAYQLAISELVAKYEKTVLTREERSEWDNFKQHLQQFHANGSDANQHYVQTLKSLNHLSDIQAGEGKHLQASFHALATESTMRSYLEIALIIAIGCITLGLIGFSKGMFEQQLPRSPSLN